MPQILHILCADWKDCNRAVIESLLTTSLPDAYVEMGHIQAGGNDARLHTITESRQHTYVSANSKVYMAGETGKKSLSILHYMHVLLGLCLIPFVIKF
jgi:hypothetical protein